VPSIEDVVRDAKARVEDAQRSRMRAEAQLEQARAREAQALSLLEGEFGVTTVEGATALVRVLEQELSDTAAAVRAALGRTA
jgi:hypothetical protein